MHPPYPHQANMPFAKEPFKTLYVIQRLFTTLLLVPCWAIYYLVLPRKYRPRPSWSLKQIIAVNFTRRVYKVTELAGVTWGTRNPEEACDNGTLKETRFEWVDPVPEDLRTGIVVDDQVPFRHVGAFVWPKVKPPEIPACVGAGSVTESVLDEEVHIGDPPLIGIFMHGGGYCHMSAHESSSTSKIPRRLMEDQQFSEIYAIEYRLLQHAPFPAAVQDAAAVYAHIIRQHQRQPHLTQFDGFDIAATNGSHHSRSEEMGNNSKTDLLTADFNIAALKHEKESQKIKQRVAKAVHNKSCKVILIGDSAGGNLVLALARWIRDEGILPPPDGLLLLSPSCDPSHAFPDTPSSYVPRPHASTDYLVDTPEPRALLQRTFLGHNPIDTMHSPYVSPASTHVLRAFYGEAFAASVEDLTIARMDTTLLQSIRTMPSAPGSPLIDGGSGDASPETGNSAAHDGALNRSPTSLAHPVMASPRGLSLFSEFPKTCIVLGDAERLEREVMKLVSAMERDGMRVRTIWVKDGVHDVLMMGWWDEKVRENVWQDIKTWIGEV